MNENKHTLTVNQRVDTDLCLATRQYHNGKWGNWEVSIPGQAQQAEIRKLAKAMDKAEKVEIKE